MPGPLPILCAGAAHWDLIGKATAPLPPGADVPGRIVRRPGGVALNVALALAALGRPVALLAALGRDRPGDELAAQLADAGIDCAGLCRHDGSTDCYLAIETITGDVHAAVADCTGLERAGLALLDPLADGRLATPRRPWPGQIVLDGNLPDPVLARLLDAGATAAAAPVVVPASPEKAARLALVLAARPLRLYLNRREAEAICGRHFPDTRTAAEALRARGAAEAVVTDGAAPATAASAGRTLSLAPPPVAPLSLTGAGDAFVAAHLAARADGLDPEAALHAALGAAARHISCEAP